MIVQAINDYLIEQGFTTYFNGPNDDFYVFNDGWICGVVKIRRKLDGELEIRCEKVGDARKRRFNEAIIVDIADPESFGKIASHLGRLDPA